MTTFNLYIEIPNHRMVRGHAKAVAQERHNAKAAEKAKSIKRDGSEV